MILSSISYQNALNGLIDKSQMQGRLALTSKIEDGYLIIGNIPSDMLNKKNCDWVQENLTIFGMDVAPSDIHFEKKFLQSETTIFLSVVRKEPSEIENEQQ